MWLYSLFMRSHITNTKYIRNEKQKGLQTRMHKQYDVYLTLFFFSLLTDEPKIVTKNVIQKNGK